MSEHNVKRRRALSVHHTDITRDLTERLAAGAFPVGSLLPTELELCAHYGASRHTIRVAIAELVAIGLVSRRKRAGTRVEALTPPGGYRQSLTSLQDLIQFGIAHLRIVQAAGPTLLTGQLAKSLGCADGSNWLRISSLRLNGEPGAAPVGWTDVYVDAAYVELPDLARAAPDTLISSLIATHYGRHVAEIRQDVAAVAVPSWLAEPLRVEPMSPAMRIIRRYLDSAGDVAEISDTIHPAGRFIASTTLKRINA